MYVNVCRDYLEMDFVFKVLRSNPKEYKWLKLVLSLPIGFGVGAAFYTILLGQSSLPEFLQHYLGTLFCFTFSIGYATSAQIRCMSWLIIPNLFSRSGRSFVHTLALICLIQGPITNIILNGKVAILSFKCASELFKNHSLTKISLSRKPMEDALMEMKKKDFHLERLADQMRQAFGRIENEIESQREVEKIREKTQTIDVAEHSESRADFIDIRRQIEETDSDADTAEKQYAKKGDYRCQDVFNLGIENCERSIDNIYHKCLNRVKIIGFIICKLISIKFVCNIIKLVPNLIGYTCDSMPEIGSGFGEVYVEEKAMVESFSSSEDVSFQYKMITPAQSLNITTVEELQQNMIHEFENREYWINATKELTLRVLAFTFILLLKSSYDYTTNYLSNLDFDNFYVTNYFRHIDKRREIRGKKKLLPLLKVEKNYLVSSFTCKLLTKERKKLVSGTFLLIFRFVIILSIVLLDHVIFTVLFIIRNQSRIDYHQKGYQKVLVKTEGKGFLSNIMRMLLHSFSKEHSIDEISTNFPCLPDPVLSGVETIHKIIGLYIIVWLLLLTQSYALRLRRPIAGFFFRRREKIRTLHLYNNTLKRREGFIDYMKTRVHNLAHAKQLEREYSIRYSLMRTLANCFSCVDNQLKKTTVCLICEERLNLNNLLCPQTECGCIYCNECWRVMSRMCPGCSENETGVENDLKLQIER